MADQLERLKNALSERYRIEREIGAGGMATVYLARDLRHDREVAVKVLRPDLAATLGPERFHREIAIAAKLQHPNILPLLDSGEADGFLYYVMPYVEGESLREKLAKGGELPIGDAVRVLRDVVDALTEAHAMGVVHRDIKPENILLRGRHALVTDFGVAKAVSEATGKAQLTTAGVALGTPSYMAPEQAAADPHLDHRVDIYAVGAVAYELLTGRPVFMGTTPQMILSAHVTEAPQPVTRHRDTVPAALDALVLRCLEKKPADRWQSAEQLLPQLEALTTPSGGVTPTQTQPVTLARRRRLWPLGAVAAVAVVAAAILVGTMLKPRAATTQPNLVLVVPFENATGDVAHDALAQVLETAVKEGLQQTGLAEVLDSRAAFVSVGGDASDEDVSTATGARRLAESVGAGLLVMGRYLPVSDSLQIEASLIDLSASVEPARIEAERVSLASPAERIEPFVQRVMGALAVALDPRWGVRFVPGLQAPSFDSYRVYRTGIDSFDRAQYGEAAQYFARAFAMEPRFTLYAVRQAYALNNDGDCAGTDSIGAVLQAQGSALSEYEAHYLDRVLAWCSGDYEAALRSAKAMERIAPQSPYAKYLAARSAIFVNRPSEAVDGLREAGVGVMEEQSVDAFYRDLSRALHLLERYDEEWEVNEEWIANPRTILPFQVLTRRLEVAAGDGALDSVAPLLTRLLTTTAPVARLHSAMATAAEELSWHGHPDAATQVAQAVYERIQPETGRLVVLRVLWLLQRADEARALADSLLAANSENRNYRGWVGALAARGGDRDAALDADAWLAAYDDPSTRRTAIVWRAGIHAQLGETEAAVRLLREAYTAGAIFLASSFHANPFLEPLRGDPGFEEFVRPKG